MKRGFLFLIVGVLTFCWTVSGSLAQAQKHLQKVTVLFGNNINGEVEPCPT